MISGKNNFLGENQIVAGEGGKGAILNINTA
jgi:hypothetical protein